jgi:hypothetical protein
MTTDKRVRLNTDLASWGLDSATPLLSVLQAAAALMSLFAVVRVLSR